MHGQVRVNLNLRVSSEYTVCRMGRDSLFDIKNVEIDYANCPVRVIFTQEVSELKILGTSIGPFKNGDETDVPRWVADEIVSHGVARFREKEGITIQDLSRAHWREALPNSRQIPRLEESFYCDLRRLLSGLREEGKKDVGKLKEYEKALSISNDIVNCRLRKLVTLAASAYQSGELLKNLTCEERSLLEKLTKIITAWREKILEGEKNG